MEIEVLTYMVFNGTMTSYLLMRSREDRRPSNLEVVVHYPQTEEGRACLQHRISELHAQFVISYVDKLTCPLEQKYQLIDSVAETIREQTRKEQKKTEHYKI